MNRSDEAQYRAQRSQAMTFVQTHAEQAVGALGHILHEGGAEIALVREEAREAVLAASKLLAKAREVKANFGKEED